MTTYDVISELCKNRNLAITALERELGFGRGSIGKLRTGNTTLERLQKIADYFGVTVNYLTTGTEPTESDSTELTKKDERDIAKTVNDLMGKLESNDGAPLFFDGTEMSAETRILFEQQLKSLVTTVKEINKVKFNPNKNKK